MKKKLLVAFLSFISFCCSKETGTVEKPIVPVIKKIWEESGHNAFTDLIYYKNAFYCCFREGSGHIPGTNGKVRVLKSVDGETWASAAVIEKTGYDLRDPMISETPDGRLMIVMGGSVYENSVLKGLNPHVTFSDNNGANFSEPEKISSAQWIWRLTWHKGSGYAVDYPGAYVKLLKTEDGLHYTLIEQLGGRIDGSPNESTIRFDNNDRMYILTRRESGDQYGMISQADAPYSAWTFNKIKMRVGGPNFLLYENKMIIGSRLYLKSGGYKTGIVIADLNGNIEKTIELSSGGDTGYPGMVIRDNKLWVSFYSSSSGKACIYFTTIPIAELLK